VTLPFPNPTNSGQWAEDELTILGDPLTKTNVGYIEAWIPHESPSGFGYNPLGTEQTAPGSIHAPGNSATVQAFQSWLSGLNATAKTFTGDAANAQLLADLKNGHASLAQLSAAQSVAGSSWATGGEKTISALGTSQPFTYGGDHGLTYGAKGIASGPGDSNATPAPGAHSWFGTILTLGGHLPGGGTITDVTTAPEKAVSGVFGPILRVIEEGAADVTFIGFGLILVTIGLVVTFKGSGSSINLQTAAPSSPSSSSGSEKGSKSGGLAEAGGDVSDAGGDLADVVAA
jgi:hypothetical protein